MTDDLDEKAADDGRGQETMALLLAVRGRGIMERSLLNAFERFKRRGFLEAARIQSGLTPHACAPIACGQVQTAPTTIATILQALDVKPEHKVLEIGTGSGYQTALLSALARRVYSMERFRTLAREAEERLQYLGCANVVPRLGDGFEGWPEVGQFDRIVINTALETIPPVLFEQLEIGGILIAPILQTRGRSDIVLHRKTDAEMDVRAVGADRFLPIIRGVARAL